MPRDITLTFSDGTAHVYKDAPDTITPEQAQARAKADFPDRPIAHVDGGLDPATRGKPASIAAPAAAAPAPRSTEQLLQDISPEPPPPPPPGVFDRIKTAAGSAAGAIADRFSAERAEADAARAPAPPTPSPAADAVRAVAAAVTRAPTDVAPGTPPQRAGHWQPTPRGPQWITDLSAPIPTPPSKLDQAFDGTQDTTVAPSLTPLEAAAGETIAPGHEAAVRAAVQQRHAKGFPSPAVPRGTEVREPSAVDDFQAGRKPQEPISWLEPASLSETDKLVKAVGGEKSVWGQGVRATADTTIAIARTAPELGKFATEALELASAGQITSPTEFMERWDRDLGGMASGQFHAQQIQLDKLLHDPNSSAAQVSGFLLNNPGFATQVAIPSAGSMLVGAGGAKLGMKLALTSAERAGLRGAELVAAGERGAEWGSAISNAAMNGADNFHETQGDPWQKFLSASIAAAGTLAVGKATEGGAAARAVTGGAKYSANPVANAAANMGASVGKEATQEFGEQIAQDVGQNVAEGKPLDANEMGKNATMAAIQGGLLGVAGGRGNASPRAVAHDAILASVDDVAAKHGLMPKAAAALRDAVVGMEPEQAIAFVGRALHGFEASGDMKRAGSPTAFRTALADRLAATEPPSDTAPAAIGGRAAASGQPAEPALSPQPSDNPPASEAASPPGAAPVSSDGLDRGASGPVDASALLGAPTEDDTDQANAIAAAAHATAATSPLNPVPEPTQAQKEAGNYRMGHVKLHGLDITIENPQGSTRSGVSPDGTKWSNTMAAHYGYIKGTTASDGDHVDTFIGPAPSSPIAYVIDQVDPNTGKFDEPKTILGATSEEEARKLYLANYAKDWNGLGAITALPVDSFKAWVKDGVKSKPLGDLSQWKPAAAPSARSAPTPAVGAPSTPAAPAPQADDLYDQAVDVVRAQGAGSISAVQRHLRIGYNRAARLLEQMEQQGVVGPMTPQGGRALLQPNPAAPAAPAAPSSTATPPITARGGSATRGQTNAQHPERVMSSRVLGLISRHLGGIDPTMLADFSTRIPTKAIGKDGRQIVKWRNPPVPGVGQLFRKGGTSDFEEMGRVLQEHGYIPPGVADTGQRAQDMVQRILAGNGEPESWEDELAAHEAAREAEHQHYLEVHTESAREFEEERAAILAAADMKPADLDSLDDDMLWDAKGVAHATNPFGDNDAEPGSTEADAAATRRAEEAAPPAPAAAKPPAEDRAPAPQPAPLTAQTPADLEAKAAREAAGKKADADEQKRLADKAKADAERGEFTLTGSDRAADVAAAAGQQDLLAAPAPSSNKVFTDDAAAKARARLRSKLGRTNHAGLDPEDLVDAIILSGYHIEKGARKFAAYARAMLDDLGEKARPYLKSWYLATRYDPRAGDFAKDMSTAGFVDEFDLDALTTASEPAAEPAAPPASVSTADAEAAWSRMSGRQRSEWMSRIGFDGIRPWVGGWSGLSEENRLKLARDLAEEPVAADATPAVRALVEHTTGKGKVITGYIQKGITKAQAQTVDAYTFPKDGGFFIREKHLAELDKAFPPAGAAPAAAAPEEHARPGGTPTAFADLVQHLKTEIAKPNGMPADNRALAKLVAALDGRHPSPARMKVAQEALESAIVGRARYITRHAPIRGNRQTFDDLLALYQSQPNLNVRTSTSIENQAYSTPAPLAYIADRLAGVTGTTSVLEPTAGTGMLLIAADPAKSIANELDDDRASALRADGFKVTQDDAATTDLAPAKSVDRVVTNPPFGPLKDEAGSNQTVTYDGFKLGQLDHLIAARALAAMKDDGRAVLILGANKVAGGMSKSDQTFFNWLYGHYDVAHHFEVDGDLYARQGAGWPVRVITIRGRVASDRNSLAVKDIPRAKTWSDVYDQYEQGLAALQRPAAAVGSPGGSVQRPGAADDAGAPAVSPRGEAAGGDRRQPEGGARGAADVAGRGPGAVGDRGAAPKPGVGVSAGQQRQGEQPGATQPAGEREPAAARTARDSRPVGNPVLTDPENQFQAKYIARSDRKDEGVLIPVNMAQPTQAALDVLEDDVGNIDDFARAQLGYRDVAQMHAALMGLQVDSVASAIQQMGRGKGVIVADQTGIGKGRQAAAVIRWAIKQGHIPIFVTVKPSLFTDMFGDLHDIGSDNVRPLILNVGESIKAGDGSALFTNRPAQHRNTLEAIATTGKLPADRNALFMTYSQINVDNVQRRAVMALADRAVFVLDESHNAGGDSATGTFIKGTLDVAKGVTYLSATYAKRPDNMPVYFKTDIGDAIADDNALMSAMELGGLPLQTVVSHNLVKAGQMFRRERSYDGVSIVTKVDTARRAEHEKLSNAVTQALRAIVAADHEFHEGFVKREQVRLREAQKADVLMDTAGNQAKESVNHTEFSSVVHNFVRQMLLGLKAQTAAEDAIAALKAGEKPMIALENTMGSFLSEYAAANGLTPGMDLGDFTYRTVLGRALNRTRFLKRRLPNGEEVREEITLDKLDAEARAKYDAAQSVIDDLNIDLPVSPIDWMRQQITAAGYTVREITGRNLSVDYSTPGKPKLSQLEQSEQRDKVATTRAFNDGTLDALVLNVAGSTGISLHASEKFADKRQRHMIVAQPAQDINIFMQMLGRIHRTGQVVLPKYTILNVDLPAEKRPTALLAKKMKSLNANTSSNTESATSVQAADMLNKYGDRVVEQYLLDNPELAMALNLDVMGDDEDTSIDGPEDMARKATGRLALMPVDVQEQFYEDVEQQYATTIDYLNKTNQNELEPRTFDFDAKELASTVIHEGDNHASPFGQDASLVTYSVKAQGKPMTPAEIQGEINDGLSGKTPAAHTADLVAALSAMSDKNRAKLSPGSENDFDNTSRTGVAFIREHPIGSLWRVDINGDPYNAVVTHIRNLHKAGAGGNPFALSKIQLTIAVNGALRSLTVPATQFQKITTASLQAGYRLEQLFGQARNDDRQQVRIIVGNLLGAYGEITGTRGTIVTFTKEDGTTEQGILMPKSFNPVQNVRRDYRMRTGEDAWTVLQNATTKDFKKLGLATRDQVVRVTPEDDGITITVPKSKAKGGKYFLDPVLREATGDFVSAGGMMRATVDGRAAAVKALNVLMKKGALYANESTAAEARALVGDKDDGGPPTPGGGIALTSQSAPFWSPLERAVRDAKMNTAPAGAWNQFLKGLVSKGVKPDEIAWSGIEDWLKLQDGKVSRDAVLAYLREGGVRVSEVMKGGDAGVGAVRAKLRADFQAAGYKVEWYPHLGDVDFYDADGDLVDYDDLPENLQAAVDEASKSDRVMKADGDDTKFGQYQLPGGKDYGELLLTLPFKKSEKIGPPRKDLFKSGHWDEPNILAHVRFNERTDADGKRVLFIEEIQSDWAQAGKKRGFADDQPEIFRLVDAGGLMQRGNLSRAEADELAARTGLRVEPDTRQELASDIPRAPFVGKTEAWVGLAIKRMVKYAVDNGFERVAFINGEQSAARYDLSKQIDMIETVGRTHAGTGESSGKAVTLHLPNFAGSIEFGVGQNSIVDNVRRAMGLDIKVGTPLEDIIGKELAERVMEPQGLGVRTLEGEGLKIGGEGMKAFYDKIVPTVAKDVVRKLGGDGLITSTITHDPNPELDQWVPEDGAGDGSRAPVQRMKQLSFDITDAMRVEAGDGLPLFRSGEAPAERVTAAALREDVARLTAQWDNAPEITVVESAFDLPPDIRRQLVDMRAANKTRALIMPDTGDVYLIAQANPTLDDARFALMHEVLGHYGIRGFLGDEDAYYRAMYQLRQANPELAGEADEWLRQHGQGAVEGRIKRGMSPADAMRDVRALATEEALADRAARNEPIKAWQKIVAKVQAFLRSIGWDGLADRLERMTQAETAQLLSIARWHVTGSAEPHVFTVPPDRPLALTSQGPILSRGPATGVLRPSSAPLDTILRVPGEQVAKYITRPAAAFAARTIDNTLNRIPGQLWSTTKAGFVSDYGLSPDYKDARITMETAIRKGTREAATLVDQLHGLSADEARVAYLWMQEKPDSAAEQRLMRDLPADSVAILTDLKKRIDELGKEAVALNLISQEVYERNEMSYLHRSYQKYALGGSKGERASAAVSKGRAVKILGDQFKGRGLRDDVADSKIADPDWWQRRRAAGQADTSLKGAKFYRLELRKTPDAATEDFIGAVERKLGRLQKVVYWPEGAPIPSHLSDWRNDGLWEARFFDKGGKVGMWRDFTLDERTAMGEIQEVRYAAANTLLAANRDIEVARMLKWVAENISELHEGALPVGSTLVTAEEGHGFGLVRPYRPDHWVQVPDTSIPGTGLKRWGALSGRYIPGPVWNDLRQVSSLAGGSEWGRLYSKMMGMWKVSKTALSPATHMNNVMSNFVMADAHDIQARHVIAAVRAWLGVRKGRAVKDPAALALIHSYQDNGGDGGKFTEGELREEVASKLIAQLEADVGNTDPATMLVQASQMVDLLKHGEVRQALALAGQTKTLGLAKKAVDVMVKAYGHEDEIFRLAAFIKAKADGLSDHDAGRFARESFIDYRINAPWIQAMRRTAWPFISFSYRVIPMMASVAINKPHKLAKWMLVAGGLNKLAYLMVASSGLGGGLPPDELERRERAFLPDEKIGHELGVFPKLLRMPWNQTLHDRDGNPVGEAPEFLDLRRWIPGGDFADTTGDQTPVPMLSNLMPGGPLALMGEVVSNKDWFTGKDIAMKTDYLSERYAKLGGFLWKGVMPNFPGLPGTFSTDKLVGAGTGKLDALGREYSLGDSLLQTIGVKVASYPRDSLQMSAMLDARSRLDEIMKDIKAKQRLFTRNGISQAQLDAAIATAQAKIKTINDKLAKQAAQADGVPFEEATP